MMKLWRGLAHVLAVVTVLAFFTHPILPVDAAEGEKFDLLVYPNVITTSTTSSGSNALMVRGKNGFSGPVVITVSGLPGNMVDHYPSSEELQSGTGGYYCSSHCQAASNSDFPVNLSVTDGQWMSFAPTFLMGSSVETQTKTVTITATGGGTSVSQSFTLKTINDQTTIDLNGGGLIPPASRPDPDGYVTINNAEFRANAYKINLTAGQSKTANVDVRNNSSTDPITLTLRSNLVSSGVENVSSFITGGWQQSSVSLAPSETKTLPFVIQTDASTVNGTYEFLMGVDQTDGSIRSTVGISTILTGGATGVTPSPSPTPSETPSSIPSPTVVATTASLSPTPSPTPSPSPSESSPSPSPTETSSPIPSPTESEPVITIQQTPLVSSTPPLIELAETVAPPATATLIGATGVTLVAVASASTPAGAGLAALFANAGTFVLVLANALLEFLGIRRRRYPWGTVFETTHDGPLELAIVRLKNADGKLIETRVTDRAGRVGFLALPGTYALDVLKPTYEMTTATNARGSVYQPVYSGKIRVGDASDAIQTNIPMKSLSTTGSRGFLHHLRSWHLPLLIVTALVASANLVLHPAIISLLPLLAVILFLLAEWLVLTPKYYGVAQSWHGKPVAGILLQLFRADDHKVVATQITDAFGRYSFLVRPGRYYLRLAPNTPWQLPAVIEKRTYVVTNKTGGLIADHLHLQPVKGGISKDNRK